MVGMVIGMFGIIVMMQVFALAEERKRTTTGGNDAVTEGTMALYALQRDVRQSGYGIGDLKLLGCNVLLPTGTTVVGMAPVVVNHPSITGMDADTDTLLVTYGNSDGSPQGDGITAQPAGTQYAVQTPTAFAPGDWVIAAPPARNCSTTSASLTPALTLTQVAAGTSVTVSTGVAGMVNGTLFNLGRVPRILAYAVRGGNLTVCDYRANDCGLAANNGSAAVWVPIANNIVSLRAQYGRDSSLAADGIVDVYDQTTPTTACGWARIPALRVALVARSAQFEKTAVTATAPTWDGSAGAAIDLSGNADWQKYRYKVFQTVMPIRNVAWMGAVAGC
jgi:type IV pilus assembly protein PilW